MIGKIKALGLAFVVTAAMSAVAASAAQAGSFDIGAQPAVIKGHSEAGQQHLLSVTRTAGGVFNATCKTASFEGTSQGQSISEATITPTYGESEGAPTGCTLFGQSSVVKMNGCKFTITGSGQPSNTYLLDIVGCTSGKQIETKTAVCTFHIPEQNGLSHVVATNIGINEITLEATLTTITFTQTGAACPDGNNHQSTSASIQGNTIMKAFKDSGTKQVTKHSHQYTESTAGEQVSFTTT